MDLSIIASSQSHVRGKSDIGQFGLPLVSSSSVGNDTVTDTLSIGTGVLILATVELLRVFRLLKR